MERQYFRVKNFEEFQHYKDRSPPWIKLYNDLLDNYEFACLQDASKLHLVMIWLLASRNENRLILDAKWIGARINATEEVNLEVLIASGFIEKLEGNQQQAEPLKCDSGLIADVEQVAIPEREKRREESIYTSSDVSSVFSYWQDKMGKPLAKLDPSRKSKIQTRLKNYSSDQLKKAIDGCASSEYHMGMNDSNKKYNTIDLIFRNDSKTEEFIDLLSTQREQSSGGLEV